VVDETDTPPEDVTIAAKPEPEPIPAGTGDATESDIPEPHPMEAAQTLDELQVRDAGDPNLGMTYSDSERDWAANTGPSRNSGGGTHTRHLTDKSSTLRP
jgi:hypothetical protein